MKNGFVLEVKNDFGAQDVTQNFRPKNTGVNQRTDFRASGLGDFHVVARSFNEREAGTLHFGADLGLSNGAAEIGDKSADGNRLSGGSSLRPFLSYETFTGTRVIGWRGSLQLLNDRSLEFHNTGAPATKIQETGGNTLAFAGFTEKNVGRGLIGADVQIQNVGSTAWELPNRTSISFDGYQALSASVYALAPILERTVLIPSVGLQTLLSATGGNVDQKNGFNLGLAARISL